MKNDILGSAAATAFGGHTWTPTSYRIIDFRGDEELLTEWGEICRRQFVWHPRWGDTYEVVSAKHPTADAANAEAREMALKSGYNAPKWWQFWRYSEAALPAPTPPE